MSLPAISAIVDSGDEVCLLTLDKLADMYRIALPGLEILTMRQSGYLSNLAMAGRVRARGYDRIILLTNSFSSALLAHSSGVAERIGYAGQGRSFLLSSAVNYRAGERKTHLSLEYLELVRSAGYQGDPAHAFQGLREWRRTNARATRRLSGIGVLTVALAPGASYGPAKQWPVRSFIELGGKLAREAGARIVVTGATAERDLGRRLAKGIGSHAVSVAGQTDLKELMQLLSLCQLVVCNDSGTMHLAAALGCRVLAIFGSSNPHWTYPLGGGARVLRREYDCSPCYKRKCSRNYVCLSSISSDDVFRAAKEMLTA